MGINKMTDMPKEIMAGDSMGYHMWRVCDDSGRQIVLDDEAKYVRADLYEKQAETIKILREALSELHGATSHMRIFPFLINQWSRSEQALEQTKEIE